MHESVCKTTETTRFLCWAAAKFQETLDYVEESSDQRQCILPQPLMVNSQKIHAEGTPCVKSQYLHSNGPFIGKGILDYRPCGEYILAC